MQQMLIQCLLATSFTARSLSLTCPAQRIWGRTCLPLILTHTCSQRLMKSTQNTLHVKSEVKTATVAGLTVVPFHGELYTRIPRSHRILSASHSLLSPYVRSTAMSFVPPPLSQALLTVISYRRNLTQMDRRLIPYDFQKLIHKISVCYRDFGSGLKYWTNREEQSPKVPSFRACGVK